MGIRKKETGARKAPGRTPKNAPTRRTRKSNKVKKEASSTGAKPITLHQISYIDIVDAEGNVIKRAELEPDVRDYTGLMQIAHEDTELDEFHLVPMLRKQMQLERALYKEMTKIRGRRKLTPFNNPSTS
jgi:hypothetical protein